MSAAAIAAAVIGAAATAAVSITQANQAEKAQKLGEQNANLEQRRKELLAIQARQRAEIDSKSKGSLGSVDMSVDNSVNLGINSSL